MTVARDPASWDEAATAFRDQGFTVLRGLLDREEVARLSAAFDEAVLAMTGHRADVVGVGGDESLVTLVSPEASVEGLRASRLAERVRDLMAALFEVPEHRLRVGWRIFLKPAGGGPTPWHQDASYRPPPHRSGTVWVPLDPATTSTGCLSYLPGTHLGPLLPHAFHDHHLVAAPGDVDRAVACPLEPGDVSVHHCLTVHQAGTNRSDRPRRAFAVVCQVD